MNILFTCAGRRNYLINYFKEALNNEGKVFAVDNDLRAPAMVDADHAFKAPRITDPEYIHFLLKLVSEHNINAIISLNDLELPLLSEHKDRLEETGAKVIISSPRVIELAFDKWKTYQFFREIQIDTPKTYITLEEVMSDLKKGDLHFPLVVKPRWGSASISIEIVENLEELKLVHQLQLLKLKNSILNEVSSKDYERSLLIQEKIDGEEYGIDILNDFNGEFAGAYVRKKLGMRSGETDKAVSVIDPRFTVLAEKISNQTKHIGNMDCDFFVTEDKIYYLELNPRFGGGYPFSHEAGMNTAAVYIDWLAGKSKIDHHDNFKSGLAFSKCDRLIQIP